MQVRQTDLSWCGSVDWSTESGLLERPPLIQEHTGVSAINPSRDCPFRVADADEPGRFGTSTT